jgi:hypothetical protein
VIPEAEIDELLLSFCNARWQKVARIIGKTLEELEKREPLGNDGVMADTIDARLENLVCSGRVEAKGNIRKWGYSEIRLPLSQH